jgi:hypothetical protein
VRAGIAGRITGGRPRDRRSPEKGLAALECENQSVNGNSFCERHSDDGNHENISECAGVAADRLGGSESNETDADTGTRAGDAERKGAVRSARTQGVKVLGSSGSRFLQHGYDVHHHGSIVLLLVVFLLRAVAH